MAINKVVYNGSTLIDLTDDTVASATLLSGQTAHAADGTRITGTFIAASVAGENLSLGGTVNNENLGV